MDHVTGTEPPVFRRLRILAFDPSLATRLDTAAINQVTLAIPWEDDLQPGPVGEYIEVVDFDPASGVFYEPVDLNHPHLLAQDGVAPSEANPQFHQQMVYAVAMTTIRSFERALGRVAFWADHKPDRAPGAYSEQFVRRLRIYPHALRERNAYYSPEKKALVFGYFPVTTKDSHNTPGTVVFTCLSHDIVAHEVTHALLDGVHPRFNEPSNPDVHAFHEAFADLVSLFQHFSYPNVLASQISSTRGNLDTENLLSQLAQQFGRATGRGSSLRDALGKENPETGVWEMRKPDPHVLAKTVGAHARGAILVAAVFRAFILIYRSRTADLFRIASGGTGTLPPGDLHPDLTRRLAAEAADCADRVLQMCIRAIDYCPPVDITFGDFLRGVITADLDYAPEGGFRTVFIQSFSEWGIHPRGITSVGPDSLAWPRGDDLMRDLETRGLAHGTDAMRRDRLKTGFLNQVGDWNLDSDRYQVWKQLDKFKWKLHQWLIKDGDNLGKDYAKLFGLVVDPKVPATVYTDNEGIPTVEIHSVRPAIRRAANGSTRVDIVVEITQRRRGYFAKAKQEAADNLTKPVSAKGRSKNPPPKQNDGSKKGDFTFRAGCTVLIDPASQEIRRVIRTVGNICDNAALEDVRAFRSGETETDGNAFDAGLSRSLSAANSAPRNEPFALLHQEDVELSTARKRKAAVAQKRGAAAINDNANPS